MTNGAADASKPAAGSQTFARGLRAFLAVVESQEGTSVQEIADLLGVHRSIAYRLLQTLMDFGLVTRGGGGSYLPGPRLATLSQAYLPILRDAALPIMQELADRVASTILLFVEQGDDAVAVSMAEPRTATHHIAFRPGMRTPLDRGAAASALLAARPPYEGEDAAVAAVRERGYARSHGEVLDGVYGVAAWIPLTEPGMAACLNLITYIEPIADEAGPLMREAADRIHLSMPDTLAGVGL